MSPARRRITPLATALAALGLLGATPLGVSEAAAPRPTAVGVAAREFSLSLYRSSVPRGRVAFNLTNFGEDGHDLAVLAPGGRSLGRLAEVPSRGRGRLLLTLRTPGRYTLLCTLPGHAAAGMRTRLVVKR